MFQGSTSQNTDRMGQLGQPQPSQPQPLGLIIPCATIGEDDFGNNLSGVFHLLSCGHIVAIDQSDRSCGCNCRHAATWAASMQANLSFGDNDLPPVPSIFPPFGATQHYDVLYCETCHGIPFNRYKLPSTTEEPSLLRRCLAVTRRILQSTLAIDEMRVNAMLCSPFCNPNRDDVARMYHHDLLCGHRVYTATLRSCAYNCAASHTGCSGYAVPLGMREADAILCQECVARAELVHRRWNTCQVEEQASRHSNDLVAEPEHISENEFTH
ncbi:hypothetical protein EK21DRAFT_118067 [Setomelanomma holmii]|uniref:Uncharacterized protein n=1 Tax=Setomelanomma holmii TaxID=210430 RepID=A0A9P4LHG9_9PLEO|nr:hypothetical protein EK21DRAFT_118067 [Setomelanomma holmii]